MSNNSTLLEQLQAKRSGKAQTYDDAAEERGLAIAAAVAQEVVRKSAEKAASEKSEAEKEAGRIKAENEKKNHIENQNILQAALGARRTAIDGADDDDWDDEVSTSVTEISPPKIEVAVQPKVSDDCVGAHLVLTQKIQPKPEISVPAAEILLQKVDVTVQPKAVVESKVTVQPKAAVQPQEIEVDLAASADLFNDDHLYVSPVTAPVENKKKSVTPKNFSTELRDKLKPVKECAAMVQAECEAEERAQKFKKETVPANTIKQENSEHNKGFNRIRQRNIPFQYVPTANLEGNKLFNKMKAAIEKKENALVVEPEKTVSVLAPVFTVDTDRDYALALHLDELQRSAKASDRQLADDPDYIRSLQEAYDNGSKPDLNKLTAHAQKEAQHQNLDKEPAVTAVERATPKPQPQAAVAQNQGLYMAQSLMLMMLVDMSAFDACGTQVFMSYTCVCMSCRESLSIGRDGTMSYNMSQSVSYNNTTLTLSDNGKGDVMYRASSTQLSYQGHASLSCSQYGFFNGAGRSIPRIDMDRVGSISLPAPAAA